MLNDEILKLRKKLEESIKNEQDYEVIYNLSVQLDNAITEYYNENMLNPKLIKSKNIPKS